MTIVVPSSIRVLMPNGSVAEMKLETYLAGVVVREMGATAPLEALKAQAVAARNYAALAHRHPEAGADVCTTTHCQEWKRVDPIVAPEVFRALSETWGIVAIHAGKLIEAFYFEHCDGHTRSAEDVMMPPTPYLRNVECACGFVAMKGHGVGMCQRGAIVMARRGSSFEEILRHYYSDVTILHSSGTPTGQARPAARVPTAIVPPPPPPAASSIEKTKTRRAKSTREKSSRRVEGDNNRPVNLPPEQAEAGKKPAGVRNETKARPAPIPPSEAIPGAPKPRRFSEPAPAPKPPSRVLRPSAESRFTPVEHEQEPIPRTIKPEVKPEIEESPVPVPPPPIMNLAPAAPFQMPPIEPAVEEQVAPGESPAYSELEVPLPPSPVAASEPAVDRQAIESEPVEPAPAETYHQPARVEALDQPVELTEPAHVEPAPAETNDQPAPVELLDQPVELTETAHVEPANLQTALAPFAPPSEPTILQEPPPSMPEVEETIPVPSYVEQLNNPKLLSEQQEPDSYSSVPPIAETELPVLVEELSILRPQAHVDHLPGERMIAGCLDRAGVRISIEDRKGHKTVLFSGNAAHYGEGGFETALAEDGHYVVTIEDKRIEIDVDQETVFISLCAS